MADPIVIDPEVVSESKTAGETDQIKDDRRLSTMKRDDLGKHVRKLWKQWDTLYQRQNMELKINFLRWKGVKFAQPHFDPQKRFQVWLPPNPSGFNAQSYNDIERGIDVYVSQLLADEPIMTALPAKQTGEALDAADAATDAIRSEWLRLDLNDRMFDLAIDSSIFRSVFLHGFWDPSADGQKPAELFTENGQKEYVDANQNPTDEAGAAKIWQGAIKFEQTTPFETRFSVDARNVHEADEVTIGRIITLRKALEMYEELEKVKLSRLLAGVPENIAEYLENYGEKGGKTADEMVEESDVSLDEGLGSATAEQRERLMDKPVFFVIYYRRRCRAYPDGYWCHVFGDGLVPKKGRGTLRAWGGHPPVAQLKSLHSPQSNIGRSMVDVLRPKQDALDFVLQQVFQWLRSFRARWAVSSMGVMNTRALKDAEHGEIVYYDGDPPQSLEPPRMPTALGHFTDFFKNNFEDTLGMHGVSRGKHVPGVQSGRQAEALQAADQTILSLSRQPMKEFLEEVAKIILRGIKSYWTTERQAAFFGADQQYVQRAFSRIDFGDTTDVILEPGSLLMISAGQRAQIMNELVEMGVMDPMSIRRHWPTRNVAGFALAEDPHYQKARREGEAFLEGPPPELIEAYQAMEAQIQQIQAQMQDRMGQYGIQKAMQPDMPMPEIDDVLADLDEQMKVLQEQFQMQLQNVMPVFDDYERAAQYSLIHYEEHARTLARDKAQRLKAAFPWWFGGFQQHAVEHAMVAGVVGIVPPPQPPGGPQGAPTEDSGANTQQPPAGIAA